MPEPLLPPRDTLAIQFSHVAYRLAERFALRGTGIRHYQTHDAGETARRIGEADVLVVSGLWQNELLARAERLRFIQVCAAGYDQFDLAALRSRGIRLASGSGVNRNAVADHAMALLLALTRQLNTARDRQRRRQWRGMISELERREDELAGKTMVVYGLGGIGSRLARIARAFEMRVIGIKRDPARHDGSAHTVVGAERFLEVLPEADVLTLTCPLTPETEHLVNEQTLGAMKPRAWLVNVARGRCVDEEALVIALREERIAGAGLDTFAEEPLPPDSPLWDFDNVLVTPHTAGETRRYEDNVIDILLENLSRLESGRADLVNRVV